MDGQSLTVTIKGRRKKLQLEVENPQHQSDNKKELENGKLPQKSLKSKPFNNCENGFSGRFSDLLMERGFH